MRIAYMDFPETKGKTVDCIRCIHDSTGPPEVDVRFTDGVSLSIKFESVLRAEAELYASGQADAKVLRRYSGATDKV